MGTSVPSDPNVVETDPPDYTDQYNTPLAPADEARFQAWGQQQAAQRDGRNPAADTFDYDMRGFWKSGGAFSDRGHAGDTFKKPNHPTFSTLSQYNGAGGMTGGQWVQRGKGWDYIPSATNLNMHGPSGLRDYFAHEEPDSALMMAEPRASGGATTDVDPAADLTPVYEDAGKQYGIDPDLLRAQTHVESSDNDYAVSPAGAQGRSQFIPSTARRMGLQDPFDPRESIPAQARLLRENMDRFGSPEMSIAAYHGGENTSAWGDKTRDYLNKVVNEYGRRKAAAPPPLPSAPAFDPSQPFQVEQEAPPPAFDPSKPFKVEEGRPLSNREAVKQLPMAQRDEPAESAARKPFVLPSQSGQTDQAAPSLGPLHSKPDAGTDAFMRIYGAAGEGYKDTPPILTERAQAFADKWGLGGDARALGSILAGMNAAFKGAQQTAYEIGSGLGGPSLGRDLAGMGEAFPLGGHELGVHFMPRAPEGEIPDVTVRPERPAAEAATPTPETPAPAPAAPAEAPVARPTMEQSALAELDPETHAAASAGHQTLAQIAKEEGVELAPMPKAAERESPPEPAAEAGIPAEEAPNPAIGNHPQEAAEPEPAPVTEAQTPAPGASEEPPVAEPPAPVQAEAAPAPAFDPAQPFEVEHPAPEPPREEPPQPPPVQRGATPFDAVPKEPERLSSFLRRIGGVKDEGGDIRSSLGGSRFHPGLINNKSGVGMDEAALKAWEAGYFPELGDERPTINNLRDALDDDVKGRARYSHQDEGAVEAYSEATERNAELDRLATDHGITTKGKTHEQFYDELHDKLSADEVAREMQSQADAHEAAYREAEQAAKQWVAYHGTPHDFEQFDAGKIGTGEGAQAYGHGLYFAEAENVAGGYRKKLTGRDQVKPDAKAVADHKEEWDRLIAERTAAAGPDYRGDTSAIDAKMDKVHQQGVAETLARNPSLEHGNLLQVRLHAKPEEMLDWDKPLADQPEAVQRLAHAHDLGSRDYIGTDVRRGTISGGGVYQALAEQLAAPREDVAGGWTSVAGGPVRHDAQVHDPAAASAALHEAGIKGIRYLDQGSRAGGEGTHNVVMFDPRDIEITHRNGEPVKPEAWHSKDFYANSQARTLKDLEDEHQQETAATTVGERAAGSAEPRSPGGDQEPVPEGAGSGVGATGAGLGAEAADHPGADLLGRKVAEARAARTPEPTIRNDARQETLGGTEPSAVQAQAARDAQGRGALQTDVAQKPADEGLFAPDTSGQGTLYSGGVFDPAAWRRMFSPLPGAKPLAPHEILREKQGLSRALAEIKAGLAPTSLRGAKPMEYAIRRHTAESAQAYDHAYHQLDKVRAAIDGLSKQEQIEFTDRMETGQRQPNPALQQVADTLRGALDQWAGKVRGLGRGYLANAMENYMGHIWGNYREWVANKATTTPQTQMQTGAIAGNVRRQPLRGSGSFLKQRSFPTQLEGINAGLVPVTFNPVDLQMIKIHEMQKFYHGTVLADQIKAQKLAKWVSDADAHDALNQGMVKLDDRIFQPKLYGVTPVGPIEPGAWYAAEPMARVFNNYMSQGWHGQSSIYDAMRRGNNALNSLQLGFSGFHAAFVTSDTAISKVALGLQQIATGHPVKGTGNVLFGTAGFPAAVVQTVRRGSQMRKAWLDPAGATPEMQRIIDAFKAGGGRMEMPDFFKTSNSGTFFRSLTDLKNPAGALHQTAQMFRDAPTVFQKGIMTPLRLAGRVIDTINQPLMGAMVPRAKMGVFADLAQNWLRDNPTASAEEVSAAMTKFQDSVDNRLGQLNYDNLFWNKVAKDIAFVSTRSVGWNLGTLREIGGAFVDSGSALKAIGQGKAPQLTTRMAYTIALPIVTAEIGAILTYLSTGQAPQSMLDYFYPPTGLDEDGNAVDRRSIPGYMKDVIAFWHDPKQTALNKTAPLISSIQEIAKNRDYYGGVIYDPERDAGPAQAYGDFLLNQTTPFTLRSWNKLHGEGAPAQDQAMAFWGFQPAPKSITQPERGEMFQRRDQKRAYKAREKEVSKGQTIRMFNSPPAASP